MKRKTNIKIIIYKSKDGYRWRMQRRGRIIADSGEAYTRLASLLKTLKSIVTDAAHAEIIDV